MEENLAELQRCLDRLQQVLPQLARGVDAAMGHQGDELVAAHAAPLGAPGRLFAQAMGDLGDHAVAAEVAEGSVPPA